MKLLVEHLSKSFSRRHFLGPTETVHALDDITFSLDPGEVVWLHGPNGSGKTTLLKLLAAILTPDGGTIALGGTDVVHRPLEARNRIGMFLGHERGFYQRLTARQNLSLFGVLSSQGIPPHPTEVFAKLKSLGFEESPDLPVSQYSAGAKTKLELARALLHDPSLLLLDEPFHALDERSQAALSGFLHAYAARGNIVIAAEHLTPSAFQPTRRLSLENGRLIDGGQT